MSVMIDQSMKRVATTSGGEWAGPCPECEGEDRFRVWPDHPKSDTGRFWCRQCGWKGDGIDYLRDLRGLSFREACEELGVTYKLEVPSSRAQRKQRRSRSLRRKPSPRTRCKAPCPAWQERAREIVYEAHERLFSAEGQRAKDYLHERGLSELVLREAGIGYLPEDSYEDPKRWSLQRKKDVWLPRGILLPYWTDPDRIVKLKIRRQKGKPRYIQVPGGDTKALYLQSKVRAGEPLVLCEGEIDALSVWEATRGTYAAVATGGTSGARLVQWRARIAMASIVLVAFDADEAGDEKARWWMDRLSHAKRARPLQQDVNEMLVKRDNVLEWIEEELRT